MKELSTVPEDVYHLLEPSTNHEPNEEFLSSFLRDVEALLRRRLAEQPTRPGGLRFSSLGKQDRQLWFDAHSEGHEREAINGKTNLKFLYGDVIESLLLYLIKEAGHEVTHEQAEVEVDGVVGHVDAVVDGVTVDVKSASSYGFKKFAEASVVSDDPFGYVAQLSGYSSVLTPGKDAAWIAMDKVTGSVCVSPLGRLVIDHHNPEERIAHLKEVISRDEPPPLCYQPEPDGKSGNMKLPTPCSYCNWKFRCHPEVRTFIYSSGPRFLTTVVKVPDVPEIGTAEVE